MKYIGKKVTRFLERKCILKNSIHHYPTFIFLNIYLGDSTFKNKNGKNIIVSNRIMGQFLNKFI